jgi:parvulin-like peptidyl-prolyl isomerase
MAIRVNGEEISEEAIQFELGRLIRFYAEHMPEEQVRAQLDALKEKATEQAIGAKLLLDQAALLDIRVPDEDVDARVERLAQDAGGREAFEAMLKKQNMSEDTVRESMQRGLRVEKLVEQIAADAASPTEAEIEAHFREHAEEYSRPERAQAQHILIKAEADNEAERQAARAKLDEIRKRIEEGANFAEEAKAHSDCPSGKNAGGSLGWFSPGMMVPEFDEAVFSMEVGELSAVIETSFGCHIVSKTGQEDGQESSFDEVRDQVRDFLQHAARGEIIAAYVADLREKATIEKD